MTTISTGAADAPARESLSNHFLTRNSKVGDRGRAAG